MFEGPLGAPRLMHRPAADVLRGYGSNVYDLNHAVTVLVRQCDQRNIGVRQRLRTFRHESQDLVLAHSGQDSVCDFRDGPLPAFPLTRLLVQARVFNGNCGGRRQRHDRSLIFRRETLTAPFLGQVQIPENLTANPNRHTEEGFHWWMSLRESSRRGVGGEVIQADRYWMVNEQPQNPTAGWQGSDDVRRLAVDTDMNEIDDETARIEDTKCPVFRIHQINGRLNNSSKGGTQFQSSSDRDDR
jgi:hypothetical protein